MRIEIRIGAANERDAHRWLDRILHKIEDGWHVWDTTAQPDPDQFETTSWIRDRGSQGDWVRRIARRVGSARRMELGAARKTRQGDGAPCRRGRGRAHA